MTGIKAQRFDADGNKVGGEFLVNTTVTGIQGTADRRPLRLRPLRRHLGRPQRDRRRHQRQSRSRGQIFEANGTPVGGEFLVNTATSEGPDSPGGHRACRRRLRRHLDGRQRRRRRRQRRRASRRSSSTRPAPRSAARFLVNTDDHRRPERARHHRRSARADSRSPGTARPASGSSGRLGPVPAVRQRRRARSGPSRSANAQSARAISAAPTSPRFTSGFVVTWSARTASFPGSRSPSTSGRSCSTPTAPRSAPNSRQHDHQRQPDRRPTWTRLPGGGFIVTWQGPGARRRGLQRLRPGVRCRRRQGRRRVRPQQQPGGRAVPRQGRVLPSGDIVVTWTDNSGDRRRRLGLRGSRCRS